MAVSSNTSLSSVLVACDKDWCSLRDEGADRDALLRHMTASHPTRRVLWPRQSLLVPYARTAVRLTVYLLLTTVICSAINGVLRPSYSNPPSHYRLLEDRIHASRVSGRGNPHNEKVYVASNIIDEDLVRGSWGRSLLSLIDLLGEENVFVSIYENDSGDGTVAALQDLHDALPCMLSDKPPISSPC